MKVDFFTAKMPPRIVQTLDAFGSLLGGAGWTVARLAPQPAPLPSWESGETSMILSAFRNGSAGADGAGLPHCSAWWASIRWCTAGPAQRAGDGP